MGSMCECPTFAADQHASVLSNVQHTADSATDLSKVLVMSADFCWYKHPQTLWLYLQEAGRAVWVGTAAAVQAAAL